MYSNVGTVIRDEVGLALDTVGNEVQGTTAKIVLTKYSTTIVSDGMTQEAIERRVNQIRSMIEVCLLISMCVFFRPKHGLLVLCFVIRALYFYSLCYFSFFCT